MPKVSVIIPNYNYRKYLPMRLDSIMKQTFDDFEIIILDDCSTDGSQEYLRSIRSPKITSCVINEKNTGNPFVQWQKGITLAKGEYIWIAESDDFCKECFLEELVPLLDENPNTSFAFCGSHIIDENAEPFKRNFDTWKQEDKQAFLYHSYDYLKHYLLWRCTSYNASMILFRKRKYEEIQMDFSALRYSGDWLFWIKMAEKGDVIVLHERLNYFRRHSASVTVRVNGGEKQLRERVHIYSYLLGHHNFGFYRSLLVKGSLYKDLRRAHLDAKVKTELFGKIAELGVTKSAYFFERLMKTLHAIFLCIVIPRQDNIKGERIK